APVRLRAVASGLIIEKVRSIAISDPLHEGEFRDGGSITALAPAVKGDQANEGIPLSYAGESHGAPVHETSAALRRACNTRHGFMICRSAGAGIDGSRASLYAGNRDPKRSGAC